MTPGDGDQNLAGLEKLCQQGADGDQTEERRAGTAQTEEPAKPDKKTDEKPVEKKSTEQKMANVEECDESSSDDDAMFERGFVGLVRDIAADVRRRHARWRIPEERMRQTVTHRLMRMKDVDILRLLSKVGRKEREGVTGAAATGEVRTSSGGEVTPPSAGEVTPTSGSEREVSSTDEIGDKAKALSTGETKILSNDETEVLSTKQPRLALVRAASLDFELSSTSVHVLSDRPAERPMSASTDDAATRDDCHPAGLFIRRSLSGAVSPPDTLPYRLGSFEQLSPLTEYAAAGSGNDSGVTAWQGATETALAHVLLRASERAGAAAADALALASRALAVLQRRPRAPPDTAAALHRLGALRCRQGALQCGTALLREAAELYASAGLRGDAAEAWCSLGDAYLASRDGGALLETVMGVMRGDLEAEPGAIAQPDSDDDDDDDSSEAEEGSYCVQTQEALGCYREALALLPAARPSSSLLSRVADCHMLAGQHDRAVRCYEAALRGAQHCPSAPLRHTAHVLCMLGSATLLLGQAGRAVAVLETAVAVQGEACDREAAFTCALLCAACARVRREPRAVRWGMRACHLLAQIAAPHTALQQWYVAHTLYTLGRCYTALHLAEKSIQYLTAARLLAASHTRLLLHVLHAAGDAHAAAADHQAALRCYEDALRVAPPGGPERLRLLDALAGTHVCAQQYEEAAACLHEALGEQRELVEGIEGGLLGLLRRLAVAHTLAAQVGAAVACRRECVAAGGAGGAGAAADADLCSLAALCLVESILEDDDALQREAIACYERARSGDPTVRVHEANALHQRGHFPDALLLLLPLVFRRSAPPGAALYRGIEQAILPPQLHAELDDWSEDAAVRVAVLAPFLALLCCEQLHLVADAEACLGVLAGRVAGSAERVEHALLGHALMEMRLYGEAAESFATAARLDEEHDVATGNAWVCWCLHAVQTLVMTVRGAARWLRRDARKDGRKDGCKDGCKAAARHARDSGYYDDGGEAATDGDVEEWTVEETVATPVEVLEAMRQAEAERGARKGQDADLGYTSSESLLPDEVGSEGKEVGSDEVESDEVGLEEVGSDEVGSEKEVGSPDDTDCRSDGTETCLVDENLRLSSSSEDDNTFVEWTEEETVQTPTVVIAAIRLSQSSVTDDESFSYDAESASRVVTNSEQKANSLDDGKRSCSLGESEGDEGNVQRMSVTEDDDDDDDDGEDGDAWQMMEETIETPAAILELLDNQRHLADGWGNGCELQTDEDSVTVRENDNDVRSGTTGEVNNDNRYESWSEEVTVETPTAILNFINGNGGPSHRQGNGIANGSVTKNGFCRGGEICVESSSEEDDEEDCETWETWETTVTPPEILRIMMAQQRC